MVRPFRYVAGFDQGVTVIETATNTVQQVITVSGDEWHSRGTLNFRDHEDTDANDSNQDPYEPQKLVGRDMHLARGTLSRTVSRADGSRVYHG